jgi:hypothetical protein
VGRKLQCQTQQRDAVQPATSELPGCRDSIRMDDRTDGQRMDDGTHGLGEASFLIPTSFTI